MSWSPREDRAINHYMKQNNLRFELQPGRSRTVYFQDKSTGDSVQQDLEHIVEIYDRDRKEAAKERARLRRQEKRGARQ